MSGGIGPKEWLEDKHVLVTASRLDGTISLEEQALWLARHIDEVESPATSLVSSEELRGMILVRADHGIRGLLNAVFLMSAYIIMKHKTSPAEVARSFRWP